MPLTIKLGQSLILLYLPKSDHDVMSKGPRRLEPVLSSPGCVLGLDGSVETQLHIPYSTSC